MRTRTLGPFTVSAIGLGCMPMSMAINDRPPLDQAAATRVVAAALEAGVTFLDTADIYAPSWDTMGHNERLVGGALRELGHPVGVVVGTKGGVTRAQGEIWGRDGSAAYLRSAVQKSLDNLGVDVIDLYQWHRPDRWKVYGDVVQVFAELAQEGLIRAVGISNANEEEIEVAIDVLGEGGLASVQNEFSPRFRSSEGEVGICGQHGIAFLPWSPLGGTGGHGKAVGEEYPAFGDVARAHGVSPQQVALAWELAKGDHVIPIPGASRPESIIDSALAADLELTPDELGALDACR